MPLPQQSLIIFDLDGTLAVSKSPLDAEMAQLLRDLIQKKKVAVISGGSYAQFETQFLASLKGADHTGFNNLYLLPTSGTRLYTWKGGWHEEYREELTESEKEKIIKNFDLALKHSAYKVTEIFGDIVEDRGSQITFSALGQKAPIEKKSTWDPDRRKRQIIVDFMTKKLPEFDIRIGGTTSVDITKKGVNKGYGIHKLEEHIKIPISDMLFVGDALFPGGNDYPAKAAGVTCIEVTGPEQTKMTLKEWLN